jgi:chromosome partitioning protein
MKIYATYNIKGGVGKTSAAVNLAHLASANGDRALLWDLDPQGAATYLFRVRPKVKGGSRALVCGTRPLDDAIKATDFDRLDLLPADFSYRNLDLQLDDMKRPTRRIRQLLRPLDGEYDVVFLDCPPSISFAVGERSACGRYAAGAHDPGDALRAYFRSIGQLCRRSRWPAAAGVFVLLDGGPA